MAFLHRHANLMLAYLMLVLIVSLAGLVVFSHLLSETVQDRINTQLFEISRITEQVKLQGIVHSKLDAHLTLREEQEQQFLERYAELRREKQELEHLAN